MYCIEKFYPQWRDMVIHESSPAPRGASIRLKNECRFYYASQYFPGVPSGVNHKGVRNENLESLSFKNNSIDLHITQDVFEHIFEPTNAFHEIARTLKPGGAHIFTVPLVNKDSPSKICAYLDDNGKVIHLVENPEYHGNPVDTSGSLVTRNWGYDICEFILESSNMLTEIVSLDLLEHGIRAEYIDVLITRKPKIPTNGILEVVTKDLKDAKIFFKTNQTNSGQAAVERALEIANKIDDKHTFLTMLVDVIKLLNECKQYGSAQMLLMHALRLSKAIDDYKQIVEIQSLLRKPEKECATFELPSVHTNTGDPTRRKSINIINTNLVDIVIPVYGQAELLNRCIESVLSTVPQSTIFLVDDCSPGKDIHKLFKNWIANHRIMLSQSSSNQGFIKTSRMGANLGNAPFILFLNSDIEAIRPDWLENLIPQEENIAVVGAKLLYPVDISNPLAGKIQHAGIARNSNGVPYHPFMGWAADSSEVNQTREVNAVTGACMLVRRQVWEEIGGWDERLGRGVYEDVDFCWRAREKGYRIIYKPEASLFHYESASRDIDGSHSLNQHAQKNLKFLQHKWENIGSDEAIFFGEEVVAHWQVARNELQKIQVALSKRDHRAAMLAGKKAIQIAPQLPEALLGYAKLLANQGNHEEAATYLQKAVRVTPADWEVRLSLVDELSKSNQIALAQLELSHLKLVFPDHPKILSREKMLRRISKSESDISSPNSDISRLNATEVFHMLLESDDLVATLEQNIEKLDSELLELVQANIQTAQSEGNHDLAEGLETLAAYIEQMLETRGKQDAQQNEAAETLHMLLEADDLEAALEQYVKKLDAALLALVQANVQTAHNENNQELAEGLEALAEYIQSILDTRELEMMHPPKPQGTTQPDTYQSSPRSKTRRRKKKQH